MDDVVTVAGHVRRITREARDLVLAAIQANKRGDRQHVIDDHLERVDDRLRAILGRIEDL